MKKSDILSAMWELTLRACEARLQVPSKILLEKSKIFEKFDVKMNILRTLRAEKIASARLLSLLRKFLKYIMYFRCDFCLINVHKKCIPSVNKNCKLHRPEKRGRIRLQCEISEETVKFRIGEERLTYEQFEFSHILLNF